MGAGAPEPVRLCPARCIRAPGRKGSAIRGRRRTWRAGETLDRSCLGSAAPVPCKNNGIIPRRYAICSTLHVGRDSDLGPRQPGPRLRTGLSLWSTRHSTATTRSSSTRGETGKLWLGAETRLFLDVDLNEHVTLRGGLFGDHRFGDAHNFENVRPVLALHVKNDVTRFIIGSIESGTQQVGLGPDRLGPHGLLPPLQRTSLPSAGRTRLDCS